MSSDRTARAGAPTTQLIARAAMHAALGEPVRLAIVDELASSDRSPKELGDRLALPSNLLAHHLQVLEDAGLITRAASAGDARRKYVRLRRDRAAVAGVTAHGRPPRGDMVFLCTHNSARSQLAAVMWTARTGLAATSAGTRPAPRVHRGAVAAAKRVGLSLADAAPRAIARVPEDAQVVTVCDMAHEELARLVPDHDDWWHWSIPDPVERGDAASFDAVVTELDERIASVMRAIGGGAR